MDRFLEDLPIEDPVYDKFYLLVPVRFKEQVKQIVSRIAENTEARPLQMDEVNNALYLFRGWVHPIAPNFITAITNEYIPSVSGHIEYNDRIETNLLLILMNENAPISTRSHSQNFMLNTVQQLLNFSKDIDWQEQTRIALTLKTRKLIGIPNV